jgi:hypothetical protein
MFIYCAIENILYTSSITFDEDDVQMSSINVSMSMKHMMAMTLCSVTSGICQTSSQTWTFRSYTVAGHATQLSDSPSAVRSGKNGGKLKSSNLEITLCGNTLLTITTLILPMW